MKVHGRYTFNTKMRDTMMGTLGRIKWEDQIKVRTVYQCDN